MFLLLFILYSAFVIAEHSLFRYNSYAEDDTLFTKSVFHKISKKISLEFKKYEYVFILGRMFTLLMMQLCILAILNDIFIKSLYIDTINQMKYLFLVLSEIVFILVIVILGNVLSKIIAANNILKVSQLLSPMVLVFYYLFFPLLIITKISKMFFERLLSYSFNQDEREQHIQDEVKFLIEESSKLGAFDESEMDIIENAIDFAETTVKNIMTPRNDIKALEINCNLESFIDLVNEEGYSRYPVYEESIDNIIGVVNVKDFLTNYFKNEQFNLRDILRQAVSVQEDEPIDNLLRLMKSQKVHIVIAQDKFSGTSGIITMEDILEEIVGEINDEFDEEVKLIERMNDNEYTINPIISIGELNDVLRYSIPESEDYESLSGYLLFITGSIPSEGQSIDTEFYTFRILKANKRKIELVKIEVKPANDN
ncbi:MAG TPA: hemolysin family protein [Candidatus Kapabacteria bacterium]|nr:hemolysin family protein [Candidatus Kapabacteria bacterium]